MTMDYPAKNVSGRAKIEKFYQEIYPWGLKFPLGFYVKLPWIMGFLGGASGKESSCQCRRYKSCGFSPWVGKIPWGRAWQPTPVFLPGELHG